MVEVVDHLQPPHFNSLLFAQISLHIIFHNPRSLLTIVSTACSTATPPRPPAIHSFIVPKAAAFLRGRRV
jgi:hypothetical protein